MPTRAHEYLVSAYREAALGVSAGHHPGSIDTLAQRADLVPQPELATAIGDDTCQCCGESPEIDIGPLRVQGGSDGSAGRATAHHQGRPPFDGGGVIAEPHSAEHRIRGQGFVALAQIVRVAVPEDHVHMRGRVDEGVGA